MSKKETIRKKAFEILSRPEFRQGIRFKAMVKKVVSETGANQNTCNGSLYNLPNEFPEKVLRPYRGLFILKANEKFLNDVEEKHVDKDFSDKFSEVDIYQPARDYILSREECTHAVVIGGSIFGKKMGHAGYSWCNQGAFRCRLSTTLRNYCR